MLSLWASCCRSLLFLYPPSSSLKYVVVLVWILALDTTSVLSWADAQRDDDPGSVGNPWVVEVPGTKQPGDAAQMEFAPGKPGTARVTDHSFFLTFSPYGSRLSLHVSSSESPRAPSAGWASSNSGCCLLGWTGAQDPSHKEFGVVRAGESGYKV